MEDTDLIDLKGVGVKASKAFAQLGIHKVYDLLHYMPRSYEDYSQITSIKNLQAGVATIKATIKQASGRYVRRGMHITEAIASDETGSIRLVWFNQPYRAAGLRSGKEYFIIGKLELRAGRFAISSPNVELVSDMPVHAARIVPTYRQTKDLSTKQIRSVMAEGIKAAGRLKEVIPTNIIKTYSLMSYAEAIKQIHFPESSKKLALAKRTMSFIELFELMLASKLLKNEIRNEPAPAIRFDEKLARKFVSSLPFKLTDAQRKSMWDILQDMEKTIPANRLLEGDVGSGKTVVAAMAGLMAVARGFQVAFLAPTELLARQHADSITALLKPIGQDQQVGLLVGGLKAAQKKLAKTKLADGSIRFIVGTHALFEDLKFESLGLIIVDEQHRFGVEQRKKLLKQAGKIPHVLSMTATPIPRSLALTLYGELDISLLDAMPPGRKTIETKIVSPSSRDKMDEHIRQEVDRGRQVYVVCPVIDKHNKLQTTSAENTYKKLSQQTFKDFRVELLHGRLKSDDKKNIMDKFIKGQIDILVATTVIEVGVNVPNATIMVIEGADRFGLAQLHQLRGRVGRSSDQAFCYTIPSDDKSPSSRIRSFARITNGFQLAEIDLELRGPGAIYGTMQHGVLDLKFASLTDHKLIAEVRQAVNSFEDGQQIDKYPELARRVRLAQAVVTLN